MQPQCTAWDKGNSSMRKHLAHCPLCDISGGGARIPSGGIQYFNAIIRECCRLRDRCRAQYWIRQMAASNVAPDVQTYIPFISMYAEAGDVESIQGYLAAMDSRGVAANSCTHHALMKAYSVKGDVDGAKEVMLHMEGCGMRTTDFTYHLMIHTYAKAGLFLDAERLVAEMEQKKGFNPTVTTYNIVINSCVSCNKLLRAQVWFRHMVEKGLVPNVVTYGTICKGFGGRGDVEMVEQVMVECEAAGHKLNKFFYASLLLACERARPFNKENAERALQGMMLRNIWCPNLSRRLVRLLGKRRLAQLQGAGKRKSAAPLKAAGSAAQQQVANQRDTPTTDVRADSLAEQRQPADARETPATDTGGDGVVEHSQCQGGWESLPPHSVADSVTEPWSPDSPWDALTLADSAEEQWQPVAPWEIPPPPPQFADRAPGRWQPVARQVQSRVAVSEEELWQPVAPWEIPPPDAVADHPIKPWHSAAPPGMTAIGAAVDPLPELWQPAGPWAAPVLSKFADHAMGHWQPAAQRDNLCLSRLSDSSAKPIAVSGVISL